MLGAPFVIAGILQIKMGSPRNHMLAQHISDNIDDARRGKKVVHWTVIELRGTDRIAITAGLHDTLEQIIEIGPNRKYRNVRGCQAVVGPYPEAQKPISTAWRLGMSKLRALLQRFSVLIEQSVERAAIDSKHPGGASFVAILLFQDC